MCLCLYQTVLHAEHALMHFCVLACGLLEMVLDVLHKSLSQIQDHILSESYVLFLSFDLVLLSVSEDCLTQSRMST